MEQNNNYELNLSWQKKGVAFFNQLREEIAADKSVYLYCLITTILLYALAGLCCVIRTENQVVRN